MLTVMFKCVQKQFNVYVYYCLIILLEVFPVSLASRNPLVGLVQVLCGKAIK